MFKKSSEVLREVGFADNNFSQIFETMLSRLSDAEVCSYLKDTKLNKFAFKASRKAKICCKKVYEIKTLILTKIKLQIKNSRYLTDKVSMFAGYLSKMHSNFDIKNKQTNFLGMLKVCELYSDCRENIERIMDRSYKPKKESLQKILAMERKVSYFKDLSVQLGRMLAEMDPIEYAMNECIHRTSELYKDKIICGTSTAAQKLKYKVKSKLEKLETTLDKISKFKCFLHIPVKMDSACLAGEELNSQHEDNKKNIQNIYSTICRNIIKNHELRKEFLNDFGSVLPENGYDELVSPVLNENQIKKILNINDQLKVCEFQVKSVNNDCIIEYYEKEIENMNSYFLAEAVEFTNTENSLFSDIKLICDNIRELEAQKDSTQIKIKNFSQEIDLLKGRGGYDRYAKNFFEEVKKLKEKEAAFKRIFMEQLKEVIDINTRLKHKVYENK